MDLRKYYKIIKRVFILPTIPLLFMIGCSKEEANNSTTAKIFEFQTSVTEGQWSISEFLAQDSNITADYANYSFVFSNDGGLVASDGKINYTGKWSITKEDDDIANGFCGTGDDDDCSSYENDDNDHGNGSDDDDDDGHDSDDDDELHFNISFQTGTQLDRLNDYWHIIVLDNNQIKLKEDKEESQADYLLSFQR